MNHTQKTTFQIGKTVYTVRDLTIKDYYDMQLELTLSDQNTGFKIVSTLSECPPSELSKLKYEDWIALWITVQNQIHQAITIDENRFTPVVEVEGVKYGIINMDSISVGEFSDLDVILSSPNPDRKFHEAMAVLYRPVIWEEGKKYKIKDYNAEEFKERAELFLKFPLNEARVALTFFLHSGNKSLGVMLDSLTTLMLDMMRQMPDEMRSKASQHILKLQEAGSQLSSSLRVKIRSGSTKPPASPFAQLLIGLHGGLTKLKKQITRRINKPKPLNQDIKEND